MVRPISPIGSVSFNVVAKASINDGESRIASRGMPSGSQRTSASLANGDRFDGYKQPLSNGATRISLSSAADPRRNVSFDTSLRGRVTNLQSNNLSPKERDALVAEALGTPVRSGASLADRVGRLTAQVESTLAAVQTLMKTYEQAPAAQAQTQTQTPLTQATTPTQTPAPAPTQTAPAPAQTTSLTQPTTTPTATQGSSNQPSRSTVAAFQQLRDKLKQTFDDIVQKLPANLNTSVTDAIRKISQAFEAIDQDLKKLTAMAQTPSPAATSSTESQNGTVAQTAPVPATPEPATAPVTAAAVPAPTSEAETEPAPETPPDTPATTPQVAQALPGSQPVASTPTTQRQTPSSAQSA